MPILIQKVYGAFLQSTENIYKLGSDMLKIALKVVAFVGLGLAIAWVYSEPNKFDGWVATFAALCVLLGLFLPDTLRKARGQNQHVGKAGIGIQAGGDMKININSTRD